MGSGTWITVEQVQSMRAQGVTSSFNFGQSFAACKYTLEALGLKYGLVRPQAWKKKYGLIGKDKGASVLLAVEMFPTLWEKLTISKDGRAEALLLAAYDA